MQSALPVTAVEGDIGQPAIEDIQAATVAFNGVVVGVA